MHFSKIKSISKGKKSFCYDLTVKKNHNFFINGALIHNCDYRGELKIVMHNAGPESFQFNPGDRVAQGVIAPVIRADFQEVSELSETARGTKGFGSTDALNHFIFLEGGPSHLVRHGKVYESLPDILGAVKADWKTEGDKYIAGFKNLWDPTEEHTLLYKLEGTTWVKL